MLTIFEYMDHEQKILIVGNGAWGRALHHIFHKKIKCSILARNNTNNDTFVTVQPECLQHASFIFWTIPVQVSLAYFSTLKANISSNTPFVICSKGFVKDSGMPLYSFFEKQGLKNVGVLSGPNLAHEIIAGLPAATSLHFEDQDNANTISSLLRCENFRIYAGNDPYGVSVVGALKNIMAIGAGLIHGLKLGNNALSAYICRANIEMQRIATSYGVSCDHRYTLAGLGDLMLTCMSEKSRNTAFGMNLAKGLSIVDALNVSNGVVEGVPTTTVVANYCREKSIHAPITYNVEKLLNGEDFKQVILSVLQQQANEEE